MEEIIRMATRQGSAVGQAALAEFILRDYSTEIPDNLKRLLEKVTNDSYETIGKIHDKPSEDVALKVHQTIEKNYS